MRDQIFLMAFRIVQHSKKYWKVRHGITRESWKYDMELNKKSGKMEMKYQAIEDYKKFPLRYMMVEKYLKTSFKLLAKASD